MAAIKGLELANGKDALGVLILLGIQYPNRIQLSQDVGFALGNRQPFAFDVPKDTVQNIPLRWKRTSLEHSHNILVRVPSVETSYAKTAGS
ncbi:MAG: hypothetical protein ACFFED_17060 [Candidatus Thorarchaeota archaeon]